MVVFLGARRGAAGLYDRELICWASLHRHDTGSRSREVLTKPIGGRQFQESLVTRIGKQ